MNICLFAAACLMFILAAAHSVLGEIKIFRKMKDVQTLPVLKGIPLLRNDPDAAKLTLRMVWHLLTALALGPISILGYFSFLSSLNGTEIFVVKMTAASMFLSFLISLIFSKGKHAAWIAFLAIGILCMTGIG